MNSLLLILAILAVAATQVLAGGRDIFLCLPGYALLAGAAILSWWPKRRVPIPRAALECLAVALLFFVCISVRALFSPEPHLARNDLYAALGAMVLYLLIALNVTSSRARMLLVAALLALALANCAIGAVQYFKGQQFMPFPFLPRPDYGTRASGFYGYPNHLAGFLEIALIMGLSVAFWSRWPGWAKLLAGYVCVMCALAILVTGSRGGYISCGLGLIAFFLLSMVLIGKLAKGRVVILLLTSLLLVGGGILGFRQVTSSSFLVHSRAGETLTVDQSRMQMWQAAWKQFRTQPLVGTGSGTYLYYGRQFRHPKHQTDPEHAHNEFMELFAEYGLLGIVAAIIFLETHLRVGWNSFTARIREGRDLHGINSNSLAVTVGAFSAAVACLIHSALDYNLHMPANLLTAALIFGMLSTPSEPRALPTEDAEPGLPPWLRMALPILGILLVVEVAPTAPAEFFVHRAEAILADERRGESLELNVKMGAVAERGLAWNPNHPELHFFRGEALLAQADMTEDAGAKATLHAKAIKSFEQALQHAPGDVFRVLTLAHALDAAGRFPEAGPLFARALQMDPNGSWTRNSVAQHFFLQGDFAEAEKQFRWGIKLGGAAAGRAGLDQLQEARKAKPESQAPTSLEGN